MDIIDLHTHSTCSDGTLTPKELVKYAKEKGLKAMALTDHDTLEGIEEAVYWGEKYNIEIIPGVEVSTKYENTEIHIVGLFVSEEGELSSALSKLRESRKSRNLQMVERLNELGINIDYDNILKSAKGNVITRAHIAREIVAKGYASSNNEVFERYIGRDKPAYIQRQVMPWQDTLHLIKKSGGLSVLAHPRIYKLSDRRLEIIVSDLANHGLSAIEAYYSTHTSSDVKYIKDLAKRKGIKISGGSDYHGANKPKLDLATGYGNLAVPYDVLESLKKLKGVQNA